MIKKLHHETCRPCTKNTPKLTHNEIKELSKALNDDWQVIKNHHLNKTFRFTNFINALNFTNKIGEIAESEQHHPNISLTWGLVEITIYTHRMDGLTRSDFILAAKINQIRLPLK